MSETFSYMFQLQNYQPWLTIFTVVAAFWWACMYSSSTG